jgi:hypothetical protein
MQRGIRAANSADCARDLLRPRAMPYSPTLEDERMVYTL